MLHISVAQETQKAGYSPQGNPHPMAHLLQRGLFKGSTTFPKTPLAEDQNLQMHEPVRHSSNQIITVSGSVGGWVEGIPERGGYVW